MSWYASKTTSVLLPFRDTIVSESTLSTWFGQASTYMSTRVSVKVAMMMTSPCWLSSFATSLELLLLPDSDSHLPFTKQFIELFLSDVARL